MVCVTFDVDLYHGMGMTNPYHVVNYNNIYLVSIWRKYCLLLILIQKYPCFRIIIRHINLRHYCNNVSFHPYFVPQKPSVLLSLPGNASFKLTWLFGIQLFWTSWSSGHITVKHEYQQGLWIGVSWGAGVLARERVGLKYDKTFHPVLSDDM